MEQTLDLDWARDWKIIEQLFETIESLKRLFDSLEVSHLRAFQQKILLLNLKKYTWSLQNYIIEKYSTSKV